MSDGVPSERPALTVACAVFGASPRGLEALLVERTATPRAWELPGAAVRLDESLDQAARRALESSSGLSPGYLEQLYTFGELGGDGRERVVTVAYFAAVRLSDPAVRLATEARSARWMPAREPPPLPFDHGAILEKAVGRLKGKLRREPVAFELLPPKFTLTELQQLYERVLEASLDKRNFRKKALAAEVLAPLDEWQHDVAHRAARLYRFDKKKLHELERSGFRFEL